MNERLPPLGQQRKILLASTDPILKEKPIEPGDVSSEHPLFPVRADLTDVDRRQLGANLVEALEFAAKKTSHGPLIGRLNQALEAAQAIRSAGMSSIPERARILLSELYQRTVGVSSAKADEVRASIASIQAALPPTFSGKIEMAPTGVERTIEGPWGKPVREITHAFVTLDDGTRLKARIWLPMEASAENPCPVVVEALPYGSAFGTVKRDWINATRMAGEGIGWARIDLRGSGESTGSMSDEYTKQEQRDVAEVLGALSQQPWSSGKTALFGNSWGAFNGSQVAGLHPASLAAVVMSCGSEDRYADDVHYKGGLIVGEQLVYGNSFLAFIGRPPDPSLEPEWKQRWIERMEQFEPPLPTWLSHPDRSDGYWDTPGERPENIRVPILAVGGFADSYSNSVWRVVSGSGAATGIIGPGGHGYPHLSAPGPTFPFLDYAGDFLKNAFAGKKTAQPDLILFMESGGPPDPEAMHLSGRWIAIQDAKKRDEISARTVKLGSGTHTVSSPQNLGHASGKFCPFGVPGQLPSDQRPDDERSLCFDVPLSQKLELVGAPVVNLKVSSDKPQANLIVRLCSVGPDGASTRISYGVLNLAPMTPGKEQDVRVQLDDIAYSVPAGHKLRVAISNAYWPMFWPSPENAVLQVNMNGATLELPEYHGKTDVEMPEASIPRTATPPGAGKVRRGEYTTTVEKDARGRETTTVVDDGGSGRDPTGMLSEIFNVQKYSIDPHDPFSARAECTWTTNFSRDEWRTSVVANTVQTCTKEHFIIESSLEMTHGSEVVLKRTWRHEVPRRNV